MDKIKKDPFISPKFWLSDFIRLNGGIKYKIFKRPINHFQKGATTNIKGRLIVTCNHNSFVEPPTLCTLFFKRRLFFIIAKELIKTKKTAWFYKRLNCIAIDRQGNNFKEIKEVLKWMKQERILVLFPEGKMNSDGSTSEFKNGAAMISLYSNTKILPIYIHYKKQKGARIHACVGNLIDPLAVTDGKKNKENMQILTDEIQKKTLELKNEFKHEWEKTK